MEVVGNIPAPHPVISDEICQQLLNNLTMSNLN